jgi:hypothetical protein
MSLRLTQFDLTNPAYHPRVCFPDGIFCLTQRNFNFVCSGNPPDILNVEYSIQVNVNPPVSLCDGGNQVNSITRTFDLNVPMGGFTDNMPLCFCNDGIARGNQQILVQTKAWTESQPQYVRYCVIHVTIC